MAIRCNVCGTDLPQTDDIVADVNATAEHIRIEHPDVYGDGPERWPDGLVVLHSDPDDWLS